MKKENFENAMTAVKDEYITEAAEIVQKKRKKNVWRTNFSLVSATNRLVVWHIQHTDSLKQQRTNLASLYFSW